MEYYTGIQEGSYEDSDDMKKSFKWEMNTEQENVCGVGFLLNKQISKKLLYVEKEKGRVQKEIFQNPNCSFVHVMSF